MTDPRDDDVPDPRLRAALEHAPDQSERPPAALREAVLRAARAQARGPRHTASKRGAARWWQRLLDPGPGALAAVAAVATLGLAINMAWRLSNEPVAETSAPAAPVMAAKQAVEPSETAPASSQASVAAPAPAVESARRAPPRTADAARDATRSAAPPGRGAPGESATAMAPANGAARQESRPQPPPAEPPNARARSFEERRAPEADTAGERDAATPSPAAPAALAAPRQKAADLGPTAAWPAPLARWAQALASSGLGVHLPAGWRVTAPAMAQPSAPDPWPAAWRAWWQAVLEGTSGQWQPQHAAPATPPAWRVNAPDGALLLLWVEADAVWLQSGADTWRAPRPRGVAAAP